MYVAEKIGLWHYIQVFIDVDGVGVRSFGEA